MPYFFLFFLFLFAQGVCAADTGYEWIRKTAVFDACSRSIPLRAIKPLVRTHLSVVEVKPVGIPIHSDIFFLTGYADQSENHRQRFLELASQGNRVLSLDYPSHGQTKGDRLDWFTVDDLAYIAGTYVQEERKRLKDSRPFMLSGWSTGGLVAVRLLQNEHTRVLIPKPSAVVLYAPAIAPRMVPGFCGFVTRGTLTSNPDRSVVGEISPVSPLCTPIFAVRMLETAGWARVTPYPLDIPTLVMLGGEEEDRYVDSNAVREWVLKQSRAGASVYFQQFPNAKHALFVEPGETGKEVREVSREFMEEHRLRINP